VDPVGGSDDALDGRCVEARVVFGDLRQVCLVDFLPGAGTPLGEHRGLRRLFRLTYLSSLLLSGLFLSGLLLSGFLLSGLLLGGLLLGGLLLGGLLLGGLLLGGLLFGGLLFNFFLFRHDQSPLVGGFRVSGFAREHPRGRLLRAIAVGRRDREFPEVRCRFQGYSS